MIKKVRVADYIIERLNSKYGVKHIFLISGGGAMHLNDAVGKCKNIKYICNHHEQACAIGAEGYSRITGGLSVVNVTSGPGGTNTLTGVIGQWLDSVPVLYLSGQVKYETTIESLPGLGLRQLGDQEINIIDIVKPVTKFAAFVKNPYEIEYLLDKAVNEALSGRPGPVWLDIPLNVQAALIEENKLKKYTRPKLKKNVKYLEDKVEETLLLLKNSSRPVLIAGRGIRIAGAKKEFLALAAKLKIPIVTTFNNVDIITETNKFYAGRIGTLGQRSGNFALQNADLIISLGSRNNIRQVSYNWENFARMAKKVIVDIDPAELKKKTVKPDLAICADAKDFITLLNKKIPIGNQKKYSWWLAWCLEKRKKYPAVLPEYLKIKKGVQPYHFIDLLTKSMKEKAIAVAGNGSACVTLFQAGIIKKDQRIFWNSGCASMGYELPAAIGACIASGGKNIVCLAGDGSLQMNIQELQTVVQHKLPIKLFYLNNDGYISIKQTQDGFFNGRRVACDKCSGVSFPDILKIGKAYGIKTFTISRHAELKSKIQRILRLEEPVICEVRLRNDYVFSPKLSSLKLPDGRMVSKPLEDLAPFLNREEFKSNMLIPVLKE